jgi:hypothetical protein
MTSDVPKSLPAGKEFAMSSDGQPGSPHLNTHCRLCGYQFQEPTTQEVCSVSAACVKRQKDPTYRVPRGRLSAVEERVRQYLIERARRADIQQPFRATITYGDLCEAIDPDQRYWSWPRFRGIGKVLLHVSTFEHEQGRPLLSALVVLAANRRASGGFAILGRDLDYQIQPGQENSFWRSQVEAVVQYWTDATDQSAPSPVDRALALLSVISDELDEVRQLLGADQ